MTRRLPTPSEHTRFLTDAVATMRDTCRVLRFTDAVQDAYGMPGATYVPGDPSCQV